MANHIVLFEPLMPANTGNIARTCAGTNTELHLIEPLGFSTDDKYMKRAGLDYWDKLDIEMHESLAKFLEKYNPKERNMYFVTTKGQKTYSDVDYAGKEEIFLLFGKETKGLPENLLRENIENAIRIPMREHLRSLNLSNSVAILAYEVCRQNKFQNLEEHSHYFEKSVKNE